MKLPLLLTFLSLAIFINTSKAQFSPLLPTDNATWSVQHYTYGQFFPFTQNECITIHYGVNGDTVINNKTYHKLYANNLIQDYPYDETAFNPTTAHYVGAYRDDSIRNVWMWPKNDSIERLYYDFGISTNDTFYFDPNLHGGGGGYHIVDNVASVFFNGSYINQWHFDAGTNGEVWLEGFGSLTGWFQWKFIGNFSVDLICTTENQNIVYDAGVGYCHCDTYTGINTINNQPIIFKASPNPASSQINVQHNVTDNTKLQIINMVGQTVLETGDTSIDCKNWPQGMYLIRLMDDKNKILAFQKVIKH